MIPDQKIPPFIFIISFLIIHYSFDLTQITLKSTKKKKKHIII